MLRHLHVKNVAVIEEANIDFVPGLNVVTGETGAGKSLVVDSLALLVGARASADLIRSGQETLSVTGVFAPPGTAWRDLLTEAGIEVCPDELDDALDDELVVRREVSRSGRNRVFLDDHPVTLRLLTQVAPFLLRIHGQREELGLVAPDLQRAWLDRLGVVLDKDKASQQIEAVRTAFERHSDVASRLARMTSDDRSRQERVDLLRYQSAEIASAGLRAGEEDDLQTQRDVLRNAETIGEALFLGSESLLEREDSVGSQLARVRQAVERITEFDPAAKEWCVELEELRIRAEDLGATLRARRDEVKPDPAKLNGIEDRLALIERLLRKYGVSTGEVLEHERIVREELLELEGNDEQIQQLEAVVAEALDVFQKSARALTGSRRRWAKELSGRMKEELGALALGSATLGVEFETTSASNSPLEMEGQPVEFHSWGVERVVFVFSANPGEEQRPLAKVASGGELSRLYLALQLATGAAHGAEDDGRAKSDAGDRGEGRGSVLVFDEIDTGVGGAEAASIGAKMKTLGASGQVLAVTHLPQVASYGDHHVRVEKQVQGGRTKVAVRALDTAQRVEELARMLGGAEVTEVTMKHARELLGLPTNDLDAQDGAKKDRRGLQSVS